MTQTLADLIRVEADFSKLFKRKVTDPELLCKGQWLRCDVGYRLTLDDGSSITLKFFDTVKQLFDYRNMEIPGKESFLSYIDVIVRPLGIKAYQFKSDLSQHVWGGMRVKASKAHEQSLRRLTEKAKALGIEELTWETRFDRSSF